MRIGKISNFSDFSNLGSCGATATTSLPDYQKRKRISIILDKKIFLLVKFFCVPVLILASHLYYNILFLICQGFRSPRNPFFIL